MSEVRFYDREEETGVHKKNCIMSTKAGVFTVMIGRRRIEKTSLIKESGNNGKVLYFSFKVSFKVSFKWT